MSTATLSLLITTPIQAPTTVPTTELFQTEMPRNTLSPEITLPVSDPFSPSSPFVYPPFNTYQWRSVKPQRDKRGKENNGANRGLLKFYSTPAMKYGGDIEENLYRQKREYEMNCMTLQLTRQKALENVYISLRGVALEYYFKEIRPRARSLGVLLDFMQKRFISEDRRQHSLMEWQMIPFKECKEGTESDSKTLSHLVKRRCIW